MVWVFPQPVAFELISVVRDVSQSADTVCKDRRVVSAKNAVQQGLRALFKHLLLRRVHRENLVEDISTLHISVVSLSPIY